MSFPLPDAPEVPAPHGNLRVGLDVKIVGGQYTGIRGTVAKLGLWPGGSAAVVCADEKKNVYEYVVAHADLQPLV